MAKRKQHNTEAGYVAERMNPHCPGTKVAIYRAAEQGLDDAGGPYAVVCDAHATIVNVHSVKAARTSMKAPENFCEACAAMSAVTS